MTMACVHVSLMNNNIFKDDQIVERAERFIEKEGAFAGENVKS